MLIHPLNPALLSTGLDAIPFGVMITNRDGEIVWANSQMVVLTDYPTGELVGQSVGILQANPPFSSTPPWQGEVMCRRRAGERLPVTATVSAMPTGDVLITLQEIPEACRQSEERYRLISENAVDVIWLWDLKESRCVFVSPSVQGLRGFTAEEIMGQSMEQAVTAESYGAAFPQLYASIAAVEAGDEASRIRSWELDFNCKDGSTVATETVVRLLSEETGKVRHILGVSRDIRERRLAQQALRDAEAKYHKIFDGAMEGIYRTSVGRQPLAANPAIAKMLGYESPEEVLEGITDVEQQLWVDPDEHSRFMKLLEENGAVRGFECRQRRKDGKVIWVSLNSRRVTGPNGEGPFNEGFMEDITERKRMEDALRQSEERFSKAFLSSPASVSIHDVKDHGRILDVNETFEQIMGYGRDEAIGRTIAELQLGDPADEAKLIQGLLSEGRVRNLEYRFHTRGGEWRTGLLSAEMIEMDGRMCSISTSFDITERKQAEQRIESLATAIEQAGEQVVITDLKGTIEYCNPAFEKATGYSREEVLGQNPRLLKSGMQNQEFYDSLWTTITSGAVWKGQFTNRRKDGTFYEEDATISPIRDSSGNFKGYVAVKRDVSERIQLENQFRQAQKLESVGRLAGGVAHDFNNLLTIINGYSDLLVEELAASSPLRSYADEIRHAGERASGLTRQLLAFSRKQVIEVRILDLNSIVRDTERMLRRLIGEDIELITVLSRDAGNVKGDHDQIHQVIMNLVVNARDAMPDGGTLIIETESVQMESLATLPADATPGHYVLLSVTDTGCGMSESTLDAIFEPFFTTKEPGKGTGLGLSTVYGIVRQGGGFVQVSSQVGQGTTFRVHLPRTGDDPLAALEEPVEKSEMHHGKTVLLVEDQEEVRRLSRVILKMNGYNVLEARNGADACTLSQDYPGEIHLLLTDVVMPGMNGKQLSERLKPLRPQMKVLFSSGYTADVIAHRGVLEPHVAYLAKPFSPEALARKVREVLD